MLTRLLFMPLADGKGRAMSQRGRNNTVPNFAEHAAFQLVLQQLKETLASTLPRSGSSYFAREAALKRWSLTRALQCGLELADALRYLHDEAISGFFILHRDIKPDNILLLDDTERLVVVSLPPLLLLRAARRSRRGGVLFRVRVAVAIARARGRALRRGDVGSEDDVVVLEERRLVHDHRAAREI